MTTTTTTAGDARSPPRAAPCARSGSTRSRSPAASGRERQAVNGAATPRAHRALDGARGLDRQLRRRRGGHPVRQHGGGREFSDSEVYKLLEAMAWEIGRTGRRRPRRPVPRARRPDRRRPGARRLPQHQLRPARAAPAVLRPRVGPRALLLRPPVPGGGRARPDASRRRRRPGRRRPPRGRPRRRDVRPGRDRVASAGTPRSSPRSPSWAGPPGSAATSTRPRCSSSAAAPGPSRDIELGRAYYQDDVPVREATVLRGHAVRANYLAAGAVDVAVETDDDGPARRADHPVGEHGRAPHLRHRRPGLAPRGRGVRRRLRAARRTAPTPRRARASAR